MSPGPGLAMAAVGGIAATAAYLDAHFLIRNDLRIGSASRNARETQEFIIEQFAKDKGLFYDIFEDHALGANADRVFLIFERRSWTYREFYNDTKRVGNWLLEHLEVQRNEMVALNGPNSPEYIMILLALNALDACSAHINCNLTATPLTHSVKLCEPRYLLADRAVDHLVRSSEEELKQANIQIIYFDETFIASLQDSTPLPASRRKGVSPGEVGRLIYTSGTTGLPKAVKRAKAGELGLARWSSRALDLKPGVRMYTCLPLYHVAANNLCMMPCVYSGSTLVLSRKFSHKTFWPEVRASKAEIIQFIGELARYLVKAPPSPWDKEHDVRIAWGTGMRPDVWEDFRQRFGVPTILEGYGATDGQGATLNPNRGGFGRGAIAVRGSLWQIMNGAGECRIRIDSDTEQVIRNADGFAVKCQVDEVGETIHKVDPGMEKAVFSRYHNNEAAGDKRKLRNVFEKGDLWFRSGDLMREDSDGCLYFVDRLGDTFRWHGENVSTNEVAEMLDGFSQIAEINVYGVQVPHTDGRAGCAAILPVKDLAVKDFNFGGLARYALSHLPRYAVPVFLRFVTEMDLTGTMKLQKGRVKTEGVDLDKIQESSPGDAMYWMPPSKNEYIPYELADWEKVHAGKVKL